MLVAGSKGIGYVRKVLGLFDGSMGLPHCGRAVQLGRDPFRNIRRRHSQPGDKTQQADSGNGSRIFPFRVFGHAGQPDGFDVDLAKLAAQELGVPVEIKDMEFSGLIPALQGGKVDMIISGMSRTPERAKTVSFTQPYFEAGLCALISNKRAPEFPKSAS